MKIILLALFLFSSIYAGPATDTTSNDHKISSSEYIKKHMKLMKIYDKKTHSFHGFFIIPKYSGHDIFESNEPRGLNACKETTDNYICPAIDAKTYRSILVRGKIRNNEDEIIRRPKENAIFLVYRMRDDMYYIDPVSGLETSGTIYEEYDVGSEIKKIEYDDMAHKTFIYDDGVVTEDKSARKSNYYYSDKAVTNKNFLPPFLSYKELFPQENIDTIGDNICYSFDKLNVPQLKSSSKCGENIEDKMITSPMFFEKYEFLNSHIAKNAGYHHNLLETLDNLTDNFGKSFCMVSGLMGELAKEKTTNKDICIISKIYANDGTQIKRPVYNFKYILKKISRKQTSGEIKQYKKLASIRQQKVMCIEQTHRNILLDNGDTVQIAEILVGNIGYNSNMDRQCSISKDLNDGFDFSNITEGILYNHARKSKTTASYRLDSNNPSLIKGSLTYNANTKTTSANVLCSDPDGYWGEIINDECHIKYLDDNGKVISNKSETFDIFMANYKDDKKNISPKDYNPNLGCMYTNNIDVDFEYQCDFESNKYADAPPSIFLDFASNNYVEINGPATIEKQLAIFDAKNEFNIKERELFEDKLTSHLNYLTLCHKIKVRTYPINDRTCINNSMLVDLEKYRTKSIKDKFDNAMPSLDDSTEEITFGYHSLYPASSDVTINEMREYYYKQLILPKINECVFDKKKKQYHSNYEQGCSRSDLNSLGDISIVNTIKSSSPGMFFPVGSVQSNIQAGDAVDFTLPDDFTSPLKKRVDAVRIKSAGGIFRGIVSILKVSLLAIFPEEFVIIKMGEAFLNDLITKIEGSGNKETQEVVKSRMGEIIKVRNEEAAQLVKSFNESLEVRNSGLMKAAMVRVGAGPEEDINQKINGLYSVKNYAELNEIEKTIRREQNLNYSSLVALINAEYIVAETEDRLSMLKVTKELSETSGINTLQLLF